MSPSLDSVGRSSTAERRTLPIGVIGLGRLGSALAGALAAVGYHNVTVTGRDAARVERRAPLLGVTAQPIDTLVERSALVFLTVPDHAIEGLGDRLRWPAGQGVVHCSGALGLDVLRGVEAGGAHAGCLHPLQTFPAASSGTALTMRACADLFEGIVCGVEGAAPVGDLLMAIADDLSARIVRLEGVDRALYHAAAVLVSNDVIALMAAASRAWERAGLDVTAAQTALAPLLLAASSNAAHLPLAAALTGPIARGDAATVERHLRALDADPGLRALYRALGRELLGLDLGLSAEARAALEALLHEG
ncbi:MAG: DUF2520 domain-containing protein [Chloroflexi bacterium]|nr:MAG: DUF2520 domain-containing protein [Chloroflexota bacterium]